MARNVYNRTTQTLTALQAWTFSYGLVSVGLTLYMKKHVPR